MSMAWVMLYIYKYNFGFKLCTLKGREIYPYNYQHTYFYMSVCTTIELHVQIWIWNKIAKIYKNHWNYIITHVAEALNPHTICALWQIILVIEAQSMSNSTTKPRLHVGLSPIRQIDGRYDCITKKGYNDSSNASDFQECSDGSDDMPAWLKTFINVSMGKTECNIDRVKDQGDGYV